ncbi:type II secretion system F family protein [Thermophilibacter provencensis]|uniref:Type II secretion system F family protein n=1 Tax=Thermophilibacter provencensis TaxID=1852386 RepID=A0ABT7V191_9ACTN|nr:type II secretion system F family protein [Thermophilibacter provencensis]MDM8270370.1 type II secretion system F family protein [Thermophilibacter provencensis]
MEIAFPLMAALAAALAPFSLLGGDPDASQLLSTGRLRRTVGRTVRLLGRMGRARPLSRLLELGVTRRAAGELADTALAREVGLDAYGAVASLVCAVLLVTLTASAVFWSVVAGVASGVATVALVAARDASRRQRAKREVAMAMPGIYRTLSVALGSGQTLSQAVEYVGAHERGAAAGIFARMSLRLRCGVSTEDAVRQLAEELEVSGADLLAAALVISHRTGSPLRDLLTRSARLAERQGEFERLLAVKTAQVRLSVKIVCLLPVVMVGVLAIISPDFQSGLLTPVGMGCVLLAAGLDALALVLIRRLVRAVI